MNLHSQLGNYLRVYPQWRFAPPRVQLKRCLERFGVDYAGYCLDVSTIHSGAIVYSLGIGEDISFDLSLIDRFGVEVEAFDPTPKVKRWLGTQSLPRQFHFHEAGIAANDGEETFYLPLREDWVSHSVIQARQSGRESVRLPVMRLSTAMKLQGHDRIDVLKMDIEGAEYAVIEEIVRKKIPVRQLLVEFHHRLSSVGTDKTRIALAQLEKYGMRISYVCSRKEVFTFAQAV
ncbi:MAG TPA: FkbM family methyltransferase [Verrucomicrobiae bacterium]|jgi:FkbM family methyltransferase|nr:FkbM family methyltransferase [Verrucomicrobiae bacterium]